MKKTLLLVILLLPLFLQAQQPTVGLIQYNVPNTDGYVLFAPMAGTKTYLIDKCGQTINQWQSTYRPGLSAYLTPDGSLYRSGNTNNTVFDSGGSGGLIEKYDWEGNLLWSYRLSDSTQCQHHDFTVMPNGNLLLIVWQLHTTADATANGRNPAQLGTGFWSEKIIEIQPVGTNQATVVWQWDVWDHLVQEFDNTKLNYGVISQHPELVNINYIGGQPTSADWIHLNSVQYNEGLDQILLSVHAFSEVWIIDHSTNTVQAATHSGGNAGRGGDLLYRWGNPRTYGRGTPADRVFYAQHHATWVPAGYPNAGKIKVFNNGQGRPGGNYSSVDMIAPPLEQNNTYTLSGNTAYGPDSLYWTYAAPTPANLYASNISGAYMLANGSCIITNGPAGVFFEIDSNKNTVWEYINPVANGNPVSQGTSPVNNLVFRAEFYPLDYFTFNPPLIPGNEIELNPTSPSICEQLGVGIAEVLPNTFTMYPNPANAMVYINSTQGIALVEVTNTAGQVCYSAANSATIDVSMLPAGLYSVRVKTGNQTLLGRLAVVK